MEGGDREIARSKRIGEKRVPWNELIRLFRFSFGITIFAAE